MRLRLVMTESLIAHAALVLCGMALIWILLYGLIVQRLNLRHPKRYVAMRGTARLRKNSIDWLFSLLQFLCFGEHRELQDPTMSGLCLLIKACTVAIFLLFVFLMFGPIFLPGGR